jgi:hypothetical protein
VCGWTGIARSITILDENAPGTAATPQPGAGTPTATATPATPTATPTPTPTPTSTLPPPTNLTAASSPWGDAVTITWTAPPFTLVAFRITLLEGDGDERPLLEVPGTQLKATIQGLDPRRGYSFLVRAVSLDGQLSQPSSAISNAGAPTMTPLPTPSPPPWCTPVATGGPPLCPGGPFPAPGAFGFPGLPGQSFPVTAALAGPATAALTWTAVPGAASYTVLQGVNGAPLQPWGPATAPTASVPLGQPNSTYVFQVQALDPNGAVLAVSVPTPPLTAGAAPGAVPAGGVPSAAHSHFVAPANPVSLAASAGMVTITAQVRDAQGAPLPNVAVTATASPAGTTLTPLQPTTDGAGNATFQLTGPAGPPVTISGTAGGIALPPLVVTLVP